MSIVLGLDIKQMAQDLQVELTETIKAIKQLSEVDRQALVTAVSAEVTARSETDECFEIDAFEAILCYQIMELLKDTV